MNSGRRNRFVNPYNFIPLDPQEKKQISKADERDKKFYGEIKYTLTTKTPLFIPNTSSDDAFKMNHGIEDEKERHKNQDFFSYKDLSKVKESTANNPPEPIIPGSEVRGMFRSNYEILTNSCASVVDEDMWEKTPEKKRPKTIDNYFPCGKSKQLCPACSLFGVLRDENPNVSRVRFTDLKGVKLEDYSSVYEKIYTLPFLASPRKYLKGRKYYPHQKNVNLIYNNKRDKKNVTIRPLKANKKFNGIIYFDGVSRDELDTLIYLVNCDALHGYKLGRGKPLGLGSVQTKITSVEYYYPTLDEGTGTVELKTESYSFNQIKTSKLIDSTIIPQFKEMTLLNKIDNKQCGYPGSGSSDQRHYNNKKKKNSGKGKEKIPVGFESSVYIKKIDEKSVYFDNYHNNGREGKFSKSRLKGAVVEVGDKIKVTYNGTDKNGPDRYDFVSKVK